MGKVIKKRSLKAGLPPGTLVHIGERKAESVRITVIDYDEEHFQEKQVATIEECFEFKATPTITWINIDGIHKIEIIEKISRHYELHPLLLEDILNTNQRPKFQDFEKYIYTSCSECSVTITRSKQSNLNKSVWYSAQIL